MVEFAINSSISETTKYAPFELNQGYLPRIMNKIGQNEHVPKGIREFANNALMNLASAHDAIIEARTFQTSRANRKQQQEPIIKKGNMVYLSTKNLSLLKNRTNKLCPKYIGPYRVIETKPNMSNYTLELPTALQARCIHPTFHVSLLRPYQANNDEMFPIRTQPEPYDFGADDEQEWFVDEIVGHRQRGKKGIEFEVRWTMGDTTWEPMDNCKDLAALDQYLAVHGVNEVKELPIRKNKQK